MTLDPSLTTSSLMLRSSRLFRGAATFASRCLSTAASQPVDVRAAASYASSGVDIVALHRLLEREW